MGNDKLNIIDLVELQFIENAISARQSETHRVKNNPELTEAEKSFDQSKEIHEEVNGQYHDLETKRKKLEDTVGLNDEKIKTNENKLFSGTITDAKELSNYQEEIEMLKNSNSKLEDEILEIMEKQDQLAPRVQSSKKDMEELEAMVKRIKGEMGEKLEVLKHNSEGLTNRKKDIITRIPEDYIKKYNDLKTKKGGIAVSVIRDNFCNVCNMEIPSVEAEKFVDSEQVYRCPICGRMSVLHRPEIDDIKKELES